MPMHDWTRVDANFFHHFHLNWISSLSHALNNGLLPSGYYARAEKVQPPFIPDLLTIQTPDAEPGGIATMTRPKTQYAEVATRIRPLRPPERQIALREEETDRMVAVIEIVSRSNKKSSGVREFVEKAVMLLENGINVLVLDCYPPRKRDPQGLHARIWGQLMDRPDAQAVTGPAMASYACEAEDTFAYFLQPVTVGQALPDMPLYLAPERFVSLPLENTYQYAFESFSPRERKLLEV